MEAKTTVDPQTRGAILNLYQQRLPQAEIAAKLMLPLDLVADVLDLKR